MNRFKILKGHQPPPAKCAVCGDSGVIETGSNDLPCDCPAGDKALFNVAGEGKVFGKAIKEQAARKKAVKTPQDIAAEFWRNLEGRI